MLYEEINNKKIIKPLFKWIGGKTQLLDELTSLLPESYGTYYEPFAGGAALYFAIQPKKAVLNDLNSQLMNVYDCCKNI